MNPKIKFISVAIHNGSPDRIYLTFEDMPSPFPNMGYEGQFRMEAQAGHGVAWVQSFFGRNPDEVLDMNTGTLQTFKFSETQ